ncbi:MAG: bifunctional ornithine acetyltransferase/N-acetylglutamate synthase [Candidatus Methanomethylophilaceae archaeon]|jgi:glutamate N-acetyltransferase/amino-acid N-acetyltransferase|nr:bifunctional ornithine acetyltransferase/N-acetylglutamate synthase [Thermoplasmata archaeon]MBR3410536.1 bifunctional ornithine acetyltransferase/N-acetylglutamate synthase [Candidatus Methanomethylophilaceae archaeon]MBR3476531.1 bifunctional ornithine acetyltransferase/N-acetylglutamate synthase [Candidatus Methanomethylophilaceae archaeon]MBR4697061.1 bifunctional ornithine acetyltransferase/N-acetylglutamate synthase [Candidatus Methanomethylophilaceae archaeon]
MVEIIDGGVTTPQGFKAAGVHSGVKYRSLDLGLLYSEVPASAFVGYTSNNVKAAPVQVMMKENSPTLSAVVVNSGNANALTGRRGIEDAISMKQSVANELGLDPVQVGVMSTGLIGRFMDMHKIRYGISRAAKELSTGREADNLIAEAIMTTDTIKKECAARVRLSDGTLVYIGAISKGSGMISPHMKVLHGTTLSLVTTDANLSPAFREKWGAILDDSMNMVSVDGDQSTNDTCILLANGMSNGRCADDDPEFESALRIVMTKIARTIAMDGEGATKLIEVQVTGAETKDEARKVVKTIIDSPLVKSAIFGSDPNYGRIMMAVGNSGAKFSMEDVRLIIKGGDMEVPILDAGSPIFQEERAVEVVRMAMDNKEVTIMVDLGVGKEEAIGWGCDLTYDYVRINAEYAT